jgi:hypothetical protein
MTYGMGLRVPAMPNNRNVGWTSCDWTGLLAFDSAPAAGRLVRPLTAGEQGTINDDNFIELCEVLVSNITHFQLAVSSLDKLDFEVDLTST